MNIADGAGTLARVQLQRDGACVAFVGVCVRVRASRYQKHGVWNILVVHRYECRCVYMHAVREFGLVARAAHTVGLQHT